MIHIFLCVRYCILFKLRTFRSPCLALLIFKRVLFGGLKQGRLQRSSYPTIITTITVALLCILVVAKFSESELCSPGTFKFYSL